MDVVIINCNHQNGLSDLFIKKNVSVLPHSRPAVILDMPNEHYALPLAASHSLPSYHGVVQGERI